MSTDIRSLPWKGRIPEKGWLSVESADHLSRGDSVHGLQGKLDEYLESQNEDPEDYAYVYLITAPRFLGYSFNPVSFWYLYDVSNKLKAMVLEVNNTFDERRVYFLKDTESDTIHEDGKGKQPASSKFATTWPKDFHVSPFNSRKGSYSLAALDPFSHQLHGKGPVDNTITLSSSKQHAKLVARVFSIAKPLDPATFGRLDVLKFIASWWWVGLVTFPRIVREAAKLFFRRKLHVWYRPEVLKESIGRTETTDERAIALMFRDFLKAAVASSDLPIPLKYIPALPTEHGEEVFTPNNLFNGSNPPHEVMIFKPTSPLFYDNLTRAINITDFLITSISSPDIKTHVLYISHPNHLVHLAPPTMNLETPKHSKSNLSTLPLIARISWSLIAFLRCPTTRPSYSHLSPLDTYAIRHRISDSKKVQAYWQATFKLLLSDRIAFSQPIIIDAALFILRLWLCWICAQSHVAFADESTSISIPRTLLGIVGVHVWRNLGCRLYLAGVMLLGFWKIGEMLGLV